ncbi:MAG: ParB/RepB/Spo0J family partition protein [Hyphomonadaceae bacterium]
MNNDPKAKPRLGKGLSALMGEVEGMRPAATAEPASADTAPTGPAAGAAEVPLNRIHPNPAQPRRHFDKDKLDELAESLRTKGVLQAILVRPDPKDPQQYQIIAGERRWRAAKLAGLERIPVMIRDVDELELLEVGIIENVQRADLNPIEEAEAYGALMKRFGRTQESLATSVGKSRAHIANTLRLLNLSETAREHLSAGRISAGAARAAMGGEDPDLLIEQAVAKSLSVRDVEALARLSKGAVPPVGGSSGEKPKPSYKDVDTEALESDLMRVLGLMVDIRHKDAGGGELRIKYRDLEQLDDVCRRLTAKRGEPS